jgi:hypothetical protein
MALRIGIIPARIASRTAGRAASQRLAPNAREVSTSSRRPTSSPPRRSSPSEIPVRVLPKIMPRKGIAYCGRYHGSARTTVSRATAVTTHEPAATEMIPSSQMPG